MLGFEGHDLSLLNGRHIRSGKVAAEQIIEKLRKAEL
jgi:hypothetical protein